MYKKGLKRVYSFFFVGTHLRATERHLPHGITRCHRLPNTGERAPP